MNLNLLASGQGLGQAAFVPQLQLQGIQQAIYNRETGFGRLLGLSGFAVKPVDVLTQDFNDYLKDWDK